MPFPSVFGSLWTPHRAAAWTALFLFLLTASAYFCGVNAKRALQHAVFIVPFIALWLLSLPARSNESRSGWQKVCLAAAVVGLLLAFIDAALRHSSIKRTRPNPCRLSYWNQQPIPILTKLSAFWPPNGPGRSWGRYSLSQR